VGGKERVDGRYRDGGIPPEEQRWSDREMVVLVMTEGVVRRVELHGDV